MSNEINLSTSVKYHQFLNIDDIVEFLKKECNFVQDDDFEISSSEEITLLNHDDGDFPFLKNEYVFFITSDLAIWFEEMQKILVTSEDYGKKIIKSLIENEHAHDQYLEAIYSNKRLNCLLSVSGNKCKAYEGS